MICTPAVSQYASKRLAEEHIWSIVISVIFVRYTKSFQVLEHALHQRLAAFSFLLAAIHPSVRVGILGGDAGAGRILDHSSDEVFGLFGDIEPLGAYTV